MQVRVRTDRIAFVLAAALVGAAETPEA